jgi:hypothetical protein
MPTTISNVRVYLAIAEDAAAESKRLTDEQMTPKPDGQPGYVVAWDPEKRSFKQSLIAIAFAAMYLEALLGLIGNQRLGKDLYSKIDRTTTYEEKLKLLGVYDQQILDSCKRFRKARNDLVHEKAVDLDSLGTADCQYAQEEATLGIELIKSIAPRLDVA